MMALAELLILGRLEFMETNMNLFKINLFTIIFFNSALFAGLNTIEKNDFIYQKKEEKQEKLNIIKEERREKRENKILKISLE